MLKTVKWISIVCISGPFLHGQWQLVVIKAMLREEIFAATSSEMLSENKRMLCVTSGASRKSRARRKS